MNKQFSDNFIIDFGNGTDVGQVREKNEDYLECFESPIGSVFVVCDGMGGHIAGEIASRLAVTTVKDYIINNPDGHTNSKELIKGAIQLANIRIIEKWSDEPELKGMGTTIVLLLIKENIAYYACVGDSRIYLIRNKKIYQITKDQSFVQTLVDGGMITYEEAETHPRKNEIMQALGISNDIDVVINDRGLGLYKGDTFVLCSDGLNGMVRDDQIQNIVNSLPPQEASSKLIATANQNGGIDNITVQLVKVVKGDSLPKGKENLPPPGALDKGSIITNTNFASMGRFDKTSEIPNYYNQQNRPKKNLKAIYAGLIGLILICGGLIVYFLYFSGNKENTVQSKNDTTKTVKITSNKIKNSLEDFFNKGIINEEILETKSEIKFNRPYIKFINLKDLKEYLNENSVEQVAINVDSNDSLNYDLKFRENGKENKGKIQGNIEKDSKYKINNLIFYGPFELKDRQIEKEPPDNNKRKSNKNVLKRQPNDNGNNDVKKEEPKKEEPKKEENKNPKGDGK